MQQPRTVTIGTVWVPRFRGKYAPLKVLKQVIQPTGTYFVVETVTPQVKQRRRLISFKALVAQYRLQQTSVD